MEFGYNDNGQINDAARARGVLKGTGDETQEIDNQVAYEHEVVHTFGWYLRHTVDWTRRSRDL